MLTSNSQNSPLSPNSQKNKHDKLKERIDARLALFDQLKCIDYNTKQELRLRVQTYQAQLANLYLLRRRAEKISNVSLGLLPFISIVASTLLANEYIPHIRSFNFFLWTLLIEIVLFIVMTGFLALVPSLFKLKYASIDFIWSMLILMLCALGIYYLVFVLVHQSFFTYGFLMGFIAEGLFWGGFYIIIILTVLFKFIIRTWRLTRYPLAVLIDNLILILHEAEKYTTNPIELEYKQDQMLRLEEAAQSIEYYIPHQFQHNDPFTSLWLRKVCHQIATALRDKKRWVLTPTEFTHKDFIDKVEHTLTNLLNGNWHALEKKDLEKLIKEEKLTRPRVWSSLIVAFLRAFIVALLPGGIVIFGIQYAHIPIPSTFGSPVLIGLFLWGLWATIVLAGSIDPELSTKIEMFKNITSIWPSSGTDKK